MSGTLAGFFAPWAIYAFVLALHLLLPARRIDGYVLDDGTGKPLRYRINGWLVFAITVGAWALACNGEWLAWDWLYVHRWEGLAGAATLGVLFSAVVVMRAPRTGKSLLADFYLGRAKNPQGLGGRVDAKMFLYLVGAIMLELNVLSFGAHHWITFADDPSPGVALYVVLFTWFICDYLTFERVHLYTYDIFAERVGFKLGWGCLAFYPYFYAVGLWFIADDPNPDTPPALLTGYAVLFFVGWSLARGANMQKYVFKTDPQRKFLGFLSPRTVSDGERALLCSGFWGVSRHVNYLGEILMASGLALALGYPSQLWPWLYPLYYVLLLVPRQIDDDRRCAAKYGDLWRAYCEKVPRRIIPGLY